METVEVVIRIPQKAYEQVIKQGDIRNGMNSVYIAQAIINGTVLPKGHGRLIDADKCLNKAWQNFYKHEDEMEKKDEDYIPIHRLFEQNGFEVCQQTIVNAPTVIEADQAGSAESPTPSEIRPTSLPVTTVISNGQELELPHTPKHGTLDVSTGKFSTEDTKHVEF